MKHLLLLAFVTLTAPVSAQNPATRAAATIRPADVERRIRIIADDSMMGRDTPSPGLEMTAQYVASEFRKFGLKPGGDSGTFFQRYPITRRKLNVVGSSIRFQGVAEIPISFADGAYVLFGDPPNDPITGDMVLIGGAVDPSQIPPAEVKDKIVIWPVDFSKEVPQNAGLVVNQLFSSGARLLVVISNRDSTKFDAELDSHLGETVTFGSGEGHGGPLVIEVRETAISSVYPQATEQFAQVRGAPNTVVQDVAPWTATLTLHQQVLGTSMAPNTIGILEGSDPRLKSEYLVYSAHMDHIGITPGQPDSISNGADDDGSGTVGVLELAEAFTQRNARPKRSVIFMTVSGEEKGLWGSSYFSDHPTVPIKSIVADLNIDMIGRNWKDTIVAIGMQHSDLGPTLERV
ncbi:MAG: M28 family peptidase, partial [Gemmatimonadota bacterium]